MVSKRAQKLAPILVSICVFGDPIWLPNSIEACFRTAREMAPIDSKMGCVVGPFLVPHFVNNLAWLWQARRERKERNATQKIETRRPKWTRPKHELFWRLEMGLNLAVLRPYRLQMQMCDTKFQSSLDWQGLDLQWPGPSRAPSGPHLQWSGPFGSSFRLVGSYTPFGFTKILQSGRGVGGTLNTRAGCGRGVPAAQLVGVVLGDADRLPVVVRFPLVHG